MFRWLTLVGVLRSAYQGDLARQVEARVFSHHFQTANPDAGPSPSRVTAIRIWLR